MQIAMDSNGPTQSTACRPSSRSSTRNLALRAHDTAAMASCPNDQRSAEHVDVGTALAAFGCPVAGSRYEHLGAGAVLRDDRAKCGRSGSLAGLRLCMVMHVGSSGTV